MNPLYQKMNPQNQLLSQIKSNPVGFLQQRGVNIPQGMNNSDDIINYLMRSGKITQAQYNNAVQRASLLKHSC